MRTLAFHLYALVLAAHVSAATDDRPALEMKAYTGEELKPMLMGIQARYVVETGQKEPRHPHVLMGKIGWESILSLDPYCLRVKASLGTETIPLADLDYDAQKAFGYSPERAREFLAKRDSGEVEDATTKLVKRRVSYNLAGKPESTWVKAFEEVQAAKAKKAPKPVGSANWTIVQHVEGDNYLARKEEELSTVLLQLEPGSRQYPDGEKISVKASPTGGLHEYTTVQNAKRRIAIWKQSTPPPSVSGFPNFESFMARMKAGGIEEFERTETKNCSFCDGRGEIESGLRREIIPCRQCKGAPRTIEVTVYEVAWLEKP